MPGGGDLVIGEDDRLFENEINVLKLNLQNCFGLSQSQYEYLK
jgi:hypothetical protein